MLPIIFSLGPITIRSFHLFAVLAFFMAGFVFWKKGKEEYYDENDFFDAFILTIIFSVLVARLGFIFTHFQNLGFDILAWFDLIKNPGMNGLLGGIGGTLFLYKFSSKKKWDAYEVLDFWATCLSMGLAIVWLGLFFDGSGYGFATTLPWGVIFPGVFEKHHPVQIYASFLYFVLFIYISKLEYRYRTFSWYVAKKKNAQTGFIFSVFLIGLGLVEVILSFLTPAQVMINNFNFDWLIALSTSVIGVVTLLYRAGYISFARKKNPYEQVSN